jgi:hypothetical protein
MRCCWAGLLGLAFAFPAGAQSLELNIDPQLAAAVGLDVADVESQMGGAVDEALQLVDQEDFLNSMANANALAGRGLGVDYATNPKKFVIGGGAGSALHGGGVGFSRGTDTLPQQGFAFQAALMAGLNLGVLTPGDKSALDRVMIYANGMAFSSGANKPLSGTMYNVGAHLQVKLIGSPGAKGPVEWGGIDFTSGFERNSYGLLLKQGLPIAAPLDGAELTWDATGSYDLRTTTDAVPLELSTNVRIFVATVYVGGAADVILDGTANSAAELSGPITVAAQGENADLGTAKLTLDAAGVSETLIPRAFVGAQLNVLMIKAYGHLNIGFNNSVGGHIGARIAM